MSDIYSVFACTSSRCFSFLRVSPLDISFPGFLMQLMHAHAWCIFFHLFPNNLIVGKSGSLLNDAQHFLACTVFMCIQSFSAVKFCQAYRERNRKGLTYGDADRVCLSYTHDPVSWQTRDSWVRWAGFAPDFSVSFLKHWGLQESDAKEAAVPHEAQACPISMQHRVVFSTWIHWIPWFREEGQSGNETPLRTVTASIKHVRIRGLRWITHDYASLWQCNDNHAALLRFFLERLVTEEKKWIDVCAASELLEGQSKLLKLKEEFLGLRTYVRCLGKLWEQHLLRQLQRLLVFYSCSVAAHAITMPLHKQSPTWT